MANKCPYCRRASRYINARGLVTGSCGKDACKRAQRAEQQRNRRMRLRNEPEPAPPEPDPNAPIDTPWGRFKNHKEAWAEVMDASHTGRKWEEHREWADDNLDEEAWQQMWLELVSPPETDDVFT